MIAAGARRIIGSHDMNQVQMPEVGLPVGHISETGTAGPGDRDRHGTTIDSGSGSRWPAAGILNPSLPPQTRKVTISHWQAAAAGTAGPQ